METIIGIDFGTTNSEVALFEGGRPTTLSNQCGESIIPSVVYIDEDGEIYIGRAAKNVAVLHADRTIKSVKRELGMRNHYRINHRDYSPEQIASFIIGSLKQIAEDYVGHSIQKAVITVPAYFDDRKRQAIKRAAYLTGLDVARLLNEPTAAALAYELNSEESSLILVYDLGGGTFDVSIIQSMKNVFQVLATNGDTHLGGDDFDRKIAQVLIERFYEETGINLEDDRLAVQKVFEGAERTKIGLSDKRVVHVEIPFIAADDNGPYHLSARITRVEFEELVTGYLEKSIRLTTRVLKDAGLKPDDIDKVILVGGSTRIPAVREALEGLFNRSVKEEGSPDEVVAHGAAIQGAILSRRVNNIALVDVTPLGLGVENDGDLMVTMVPRNTILPTCVQTLFTTVSDYQKSATIHVLQGERPKASDNISLGSFHLGGISPVKRGKPRIEVCFEINVEGIVHISAKDLDTGNDQAISLEGNRKISDEEVERVLTEARVSELDDLHVKRKVLR